jgi:glycosyltransferase involved in cell wall biosynthesis
MQILFVTPFYKPSYVYGGPARSIPALCEGLAALGSGVSVLTTNANGRTDLDVVTGSSQVLGGVNVTYFPRRHLPRWFYSPDLALACRKCIGEYDVMVIYSNWCYPLAPACRAARTTGVPYIVSPRSSFIRSQPRPKHFKKLAYHWLLERRWINAAAAVHYTSDLEMERSRWLRIKAPGFVVADTVDLTEIRRLPTRGLLRDRLGIRSDARVILYLGRLESCKRLDVALRAFAMSACARTHTHFIVAGPEEDRCGARLRRLSAELGLQERVVFTGMLEPSARLSALADADLFLLTSEFESFGIAVVEALAAGIPVIISEGAGIARDILRHRAGLVAAPNPGAIAGQLDALLSSPRLRERLAERGPQMVRDYSPQAIAPTMLRFLEQYALRPKGE